MWHRMHVAHSMLWNVFQSLWRLQNYLLFFKKELSVCSVCMFGMSETNGFAQTCKKKETNVSLFKEEWELILWNVGDVVFFQLKFVTVPFHVSI